jgi:peptidoglycan hydrolase-like protein with peptidoglycan-binding domain
VASEEEKKQQGDGKGFAGLSSMVSDVDATVASTPKQQQREASSSPTQQSSPAARAERQEQPRPTQQTYQAPAQPSGSSSAGKWLFGIAAVIGVFWLANQSDNNSSSRPTYSPEPFSTTVASTPAWQPPAAQPRAPSRPAEEKPTVGRNNVLSTSQIRYCLAEKIRVDAAESVINNYVDSDVDRFNGYVNDYNGRCGEFRYRQGALESARRDVEPYRSQLQAEGRSRLVHNPSTATRSQTPAQTPRPVRPSPDATVQAIQRRLNELGYDAGPADGLLGGKTIAAIRSFQQSIGMAPDGVPSSSLLSQSKQPRWAEVRARLEADGVSNDDLEAARNQYFVDWVAPKFTAEELPVVRRQFDEDTAFSPTWRSVSRAAAKVADVATDVVHSGLRRVNASLRNSGLSQDGLGTRDGTEPRNSESTPQAVRQSEPSRDRDNFNTCISGEYPSLCKHSLLTRDEAIQVQAAERRENFRTCISGDYPSLCKHSLLTQDEAARVADAERLARGR